MFFSSVVDDILLAESCKSWVILGVPLISTRLSYKDCLPHIDKVVARIRTWKTKFLTFDVRLILLKFVLSCMNFFCASFFVLLKRAIKELNSKFKGFFWDGPEMGRYHCPVGWSYVFHTFEEGGLSVKDLEVTNTRANMRHVWDLVPEKRTIWKKWIKSNLIKDQDFWALRAPQNSSWWRRRILDHRKLTRQFIGVVVGNGSSVNFTSDNWKPKGTVDTWINPEVLVSLGVTIHNKVVDFVDNGEWVFPDSMYARVVEAIQQLSYDEFNEEDEHQFIWRPSKTRKVFQRNMYRSVPSHNPAPSWNGLVWFKHHIPRHSFILCPALHKK